MPEKDSIFKREPVVFEKVCVQCERHFLTAQGNCPLCGTRLGAASDTRTSRQ
jgi:rRNA maturation endonuclease Nob1